MLNAWLHVRVINFRIIIIIIIITCKQHHACLSFVSVHQMSPLQQLRLQLQPTTHLSTPKGWKAELAWLVDL